MIEFTGLGINWGICSKCSEDPRDVEEPLKFDAVVGAAPVPGWMLSWTGCCAQGHSTAGHCCCHQCPFSVALVPFPLSAPSCQESPELGKSFALPLPAPPGLESAAPPVSSHRVFFPKF